MTSGAFGKEEWVVWKTEEKGGLFLDLEDGMFDGRCVEVWEWVEV